MCRTNGSLTNNTIVLNSAETLHIWCTMKWQGEWDLVTKWRIQPNMSNIIEETATSFQPSALSVKTTTLKLRTMPLKATDQYLLISCDIQFLWLNVSPSKQMPYSHSWQFPIIVIVGEFNGFLTSVV